MADNELAVVLRLVADQFKGELQSSRGAIGQFNDFIKDWRTQLAAAGVALFAVAKSTADFGEEALKGAQKAGTTVQTFSALSHAARMADVDNQQLIAGLKALSVNMVEAQQKTGDGEALFRRLGVAAVDAAGKLRPTKEVLLDLADVFAKSADGAAKTEAATKLFGSKVGLELLPFLNKGKVEIAALMAEAERLGLVLSKDDAEAADKFNDALKKLDAQVKGLTVSIGLPLVRGLTDVLQLFTEVEAAVKHAGDEMAGFSKHLSENFGKTGVGQGLMDLFSALGLGHRKGEGQGPNEKALLDALGVNDRVAARRAQEGREVHAEIKTPFPGGGGGVAASPVDQEKLGKAKLEIFLMQNRALEIQNKLAREGVNEYLLAFDRQQQLKQIDEQTEERRGAAIVKQTQLEVEIREATQQRERDGLVKSAQAWLEYDNQVGASREQRYTHQMDLLRATLTKETQLTQDEAGRLIIAWQNQDAQLSQDILKRTQMTGIERETLERQYLTRLAAVHQEFSGSVFDGWRRGMEQYVRNTDSAFGFAAQMAQRTAQFMEQNFRTFFFDVMDGNIKSLNDLFKSFANFAKQMIAQVMAQLATMMAMKALTGAFSGGFGLGGLFGGGGGLSMAGGADAGGLMGGLRFASGGPVLGAGNSDTVRAMLTPGEGVLNRRGMEALAQLNSGAVPSTREPDIYVNIHNPGRSDAPTVNYRRELKGMMIDIFYGDSDFRRGMAGA